MEYVLVFRQEIGKELKEIYAWDENQKLGLGDDFLSCVDQTLERIFQMPESYPIVYRDIRWAIVRHFPYAVYCRIISSRIIVTAIFQGRRVPQSWQKRS